MVTRPCTSTATRQEKLCASSVMKATSSLARSSSAVSLAIPLSGTAHHRFAKVNVYAAFKIFFFFSPLHIELGWLVGHIEVHDVFVPVIKCAQLNFVSLS